MSKSKKVFSSRHIITDTLTGEVISDKSGVTYVNKQSESFGMYTTTNGLEWAKELKSYFLFLVVLNEYSDNSGVVRLTTHLRKSICEFFDFKNERSITTILGILVKSGVVKRISNNDFVINPETVYKGSVLDKKEKIEKYNKL